MGMFGAPGRLRKDLRAGCQTPVSLSFLQCESEVRGISKQACGRNYLRMRAGT